MPTPMSSLLVTVLCLAAANPTSRSHAWDRHIWAAPVLLPGTQKFQVGFAGHLHPVRDPNGSVVDFADGLDATRNLTAFASHFLGHAIDPLQLHAADAATVALFVDQQFPAFFYVGGLEEALGLPTQIDNRTAALVDIYDRAGVWSSWMVGEWGWGIFVTADGQVPADAWGWCKRSAYKSAPANKSAAAKAVRALYTEWLHKLDGRLSSRPSWSFYLHEPVRWALEEGFNLSRIATGFELNGGTASQAHAAYARGASRQWGVPWVMDLSEWHSGSETTTGGGARLAPNGRTWIGLDAGKSDSFRFRATLWAWFSGAAEVTAEGATAFALTFPNEPGAPWPCHTLASPQPQKGLAMCRENVTTPYARLELTKPHGETLARLHTFFQTHDRGVSYQPIGVLVDVNSGYNGSPCGGPNRSVWGALAPTVHDREIGFLLEHQLFPGGCTWPERQQCHEVGPVESWISTFEQRQLRPTPFGDSFDVLQTDASPAAFAMYQAVILTGEIRFQGTSSPLPALAVAAENAVRRGIRPLLVFLRDHHVESIRAVPGGALALARLNASATVEITTGGEFAIPTPRLDQLADELLPARVSGAVQWSLAKQQDGAGRWLIHIANNDGVLKSRNTSQTFAPDSDRHVEVGVRFSAAQASDWVSGSVLHPTVCRASIARAKTCFALTLSPGSVVILEIST